ncbi:MAG: riboflavin kinase [Clostridia bacterium]|nr:riboflavin kinase [Clostridia bacterium]
MEPIYQLAGKVTRGRGNGHTVGMPTANLPCPPEKACPRFGVYASRVTVEDTPDRKTYLGVTNVGLRPSVDSDPRPTVETLLLDFDGNLYGREITVELFHFLRPTIKMASLEEVKAQVEKDAEQARLLMKNE